MLRRKVIALLMGNAGLRTDYQGLLRGGVERACSEREIDLWVVAGRSDWRPCAPAQSHIFQLLSPERIDGIILAAGCIASFLSVDDVVASLKQHCPVPICAVGQSVAGVPSIVVDNHGARRAAAHLVANHRRRRFGYIAGPPGHEESVQRLEATRSALAKEGLVLVPEAIVHGNLSIASGEEAVRELLGKYPHFNALVAANDDMAVGALAGLQAAGLRCPEDVAVAGFDDAPSSRTCSPALTTARQPVAQLGSLGVARIVAAWQGEATPVETLIDTEIVVRESCGCDPTRAVALTGFLQGGISAEVSGRAGVKELLIPVLDDPVQRGQWAEALCQAVESECRGLERKLQKTLEKLLAQLLRQDTAVHELQPVISMLRETYLHTDMSGRLQETFHRALMQIGHASHRRDVSRRLADERLMEDLRASWERLAMSPSLNDLKQVLADELPHFSVFNAVVSVYQPHKLDLLVPLVAINEGIPVELGSEAYPAQLLVPPGALVSASRRSFTVLPLTFEWEHLGVAVLELPSHHEVYAVLREHISSAIKTASLRERMRDRAVEQSQLNAERADELAAIARGLGETLQPLGQMSGALQSELASLLGPASLDQKKEVAASIEQRMGQFREAAAGASGCAQDLSKLALDYGIPAEPSRAPPPRQARGTERVLVVDDELAQLRTAQRILEQLGYAVTTASSGQEALGLMRGDEASSRFELVLLDMVMPVLDGIATLERIRVIRPDQRVIVATSYVPAIRNEDSSNGPVKWLAKPYAPEVLGAAVRRVLDSEASA